MVFLKNILKTDNKISCNYSPENTKEVGFVEVDIETRNYIKKETTKYDSGSDSYVSKVRFKLLDLAKMDKIPTESRVVWY
ncbi:MAG: hypothetical protein E6713_06210 [Sporomusaceae bacterium]|nr:hypothetical protein [Sporomusaceae bacterium]